MDLNEILGAPGIQRQQEIGIVEVLEARPAPASTASAFSVPFSDFESSNTASTTSDLPLQVGIIHVGVVEAETPSPLAARLPRSLGNQIIGMGLALFG